MLFVREKKATALRETPTTIIEKLLGWADLLPSSR
jgi:hypothetical protein